MGRKDGRFETRSEVRVFQSIFDNAVFDLNTADYPVSGRLCDDVAMLGYAQNMAIELVFTPNLSGVRERLASRVCESCVQWLDCNDKVLGQMPMDEVSPFALFEKDRTIQDHGLVPIVTPTMRENK